MKTEFFYRPLRIIGYVILTIFFAIVIFVIAILSKNLYDEYNPIQTVSIGLACKRDLNASEQIKPDKSSCIKVVLVEGDISNHTVTQFVELDQSVNFKKLGINTVCLRSRGGEPENGYQLAQEIQNREMSTCIADFYTQSEVESERIYKGPPTVDCSSTCPFVFLAGKERILLGEKINIKVHKFGKAKLFLGKEYSKTDIETVPENDFFLKMAKLVSPQHQEGVEKFYTIAMNKKFTDSDLLLIPNDDLVRMNVVTKWVKAEHRHTETVNQDRTE